MALKSLVKKYQVNKIIFAIPTCDGQDRKFIKKLYVLPVPSEELKNNSLIEQYDEWK